MLNYGTGYSYNFGGHQPGMGYGHYQTYSHPTSKRYSFSFIVILFIIAVIIGLVFLQRK